MSPPAPTRKDHEQFCRIERWQLVRDARGRTGTHHVTYRLPLTNDRILRTRISHPADRTGHGPGIWRHILRDQLHVTEDEFWTCLRDGVAPDRGSPDPPAAALPAELVHLLLARVHLTEPEIAAMTRAEALERLRRHWEDGT
ncbi:MAG: cytotoxic translational repressor of toxin-antitoxin stability system [Pseudonocardia sp.]